MPIVPQTEIDICLVQQYEEQVSSLKIELMNISCDSTSLGLDDEDETLPKHEATINKKIFQVSYHMKKLTHKVPSTPPPVKEPELMDLLPDSSILPPMPLIWKSSLFRGRRRCCANLSVINDVHDAESSRA